MKVDKKVREFKTEMRVLPYHLRDLRKQGWTDIKIVITKKGWPVLECGKDPESGKPVYYHRGIDRLVLWVPTRKQTLFGF